jgi:hypothetical protein
VIELVAHTLAIALLAAALAAGFGVVLARSLLAMCVCLVAAGAAAAAFMALLGRGDGALALALFAVGWTPLLLLAAMLLSARSAKGLRRGRPWLSIGTGAALVAAILWATRDFDGSAAVHAGAAPHLGVWPAAMIFVAAAACVGLLGYGERGALHQDPAERGR